MDGHSRGIDSSPAHSYRVGIDVGGTFTDLVAVAEGDGATVSLKTPSTPRAPEQAVLTALEWLIGTTAPAPAVALICHSTTVATNALLGQLRLELPRVGLLTTEGFRDVLEIGRQARSEVYNLFVMRPRPLIARHDRLPIPERIDAHGRVLRPLDEAAVRRALDHLQAEGVRHVAVVFLHSYANPAHERRVGEIVAREYPAMTATLSSDVDPEYREYERASTTAVTAALRPIVSAYLEQLETGVRRAGVTAPLLVMGSHGGMVDLPAAVARPAALIESGPAGGLAAAAALARRLGLERVLSFDMGGTTAKAGAVLGGVPVTVAEFEAAGRTHSGRYVRGSGYPVRFPFLDLAEVSAGGGTIAYRDPGGALRVGPVSAGADPGPACYGRGGTAPTVTDANLLLGRLNPRRLLGGALPVDHAAAERAVAALAMELGLEPLDLAAGIVRLIDGEMVRALRIVSVERGHDPRRFTMIAFGGGGPLHACVLATALGIPRVIVPPGPGLFSAAGLLTSPLKVTLVSPVLAGAGEADADGLAALFAEMEAEARSELERQGAGTDETEGLTGLSSGFSRLEGVSGSGADVTDRGTGSIVVAPALDLRYAGQSFELSVPAVPASAAWLDDARARFHQRHQEVYGYASPAHAVEIVAARLAATAPTGLRMGAGAPAPQPAAAAGAPEPREERPVYIDAAAGAVPTPVYWRDDLSIGVTLGGPAIVEQYDTTTLLHPGWRLEVDGLGNLALTC